ncbi:ATP-binding protein [Mucilaginibacter lacusdianchii]|uniref:ATP-binding protein n=1 Tax=Mucilaginibacter lacusdianchii TaxID=2684211 RepID=UPI001E4F590D|nr:ATP-binding protein [Mucilaginibacter sp. JXJ CY 39]
MDYQVDLTNCDREPIHIPGKVQSHGFLVAVNSANHIQFVSENVSAFLPATASSLLGKPVTAFEDLLNQPDTPGFLVQMLQMSRRAKNYDYINPYYLEIDSVGYNLILSKTGECFIFEFEPAAGATQTDIQKIIGRSVSEMLNGRHLQQLLENAANQIKSLIGYDRIMIYKFLEDGHGEVIAEVKNDDLEPFLGLHYPATDIPKQARELYKINLTRIISDVNTESSPILTIVDNSQSTSLDLTHATLRAVSPIHIQYLKNMGVASSFSISLMYKDELWGLVACHNYTPRFINYQARDASKLVGQIISSALEYKQEEEDTAKITEYKDAFAELTELLRKDGDITEAVTRHATTILDVTDATGAALILEDRTATLGNTPNAEQLAQLVNWLKQNMDDQIYYTHNLSNVYKPGVAFSQVASGVLACTLSKELGEMMIWFKPEQLSTINWAGNPDKPVEIREDGLLQLSPRRSFEVWSETVQYASVHWTRAEITYVLKLREEILYAINRQATQIRTLNEKLQQAYEELDTFSFTISHDLRTPLSSIKNYSELLLQTNTSLDDNARNILKKVVNGADKMNFLIKEVLHYSKVGRTDVEFVRIDMKHLVQELQNEITVALNPQHLKLTVGNTPDIHGDPTMIRQVFANLLNNAIKYSGKSNPSVVTIEGKENNNEIVYAISDNGIGIDLQYYNRIFELFKRMSNVREYEGTGVGLAIVKRIIEKHQGRIWVESELGVGTTFYVAFRNIQDA